MPFTDELARREIFAADLGNSNVSSTPMTNTNSVVVEPIA